MKLSFTRLGTLLTALSTVHLTLLWGVLLTATGGTRPAFADGMVSAVVNSPIFANGTVRDIRSGINIYLQSEKAGGLDFLDPKIIGHGVPPGGRLEVEMVSGFQRDPAIALAQPSILLVAGTPQQALPGRTIGYTVSEGANQNTFVITPSTPGGLDATAMTSPAPGAKKDPIPQRGIKVIHVGMTMAFVSRGPRGRVEVRVFDSSGKLVNRGAGEVHFLKAPRPQIFPTNIAHGKRNHNWQRVAPGETVGRKTGTMPLGFLLFEKNQRFGNRGIVGAGVVSSRQLREMKYRIPAPLQRYTGGLIVKDTNGNGLLEPGTDRIIGGVIDTAPAGAAGQQAKSPMRDRAMFLSRPTSVYNQRAAKTVGGAIMMVEFTAGDKKGLYRPTFSLLTDPLDITSPDGSTYTYTIVVE